MDRIDWLRGVDTALGKVVLAIALEIWVNFDENAVWRGWTGKKAYKRLMVRKLMVGRGGRARWGG